LYREYLILFHILEYCFQKGVYDDLPALLGEMSPYLFSDSMPADLMVYEDWKARSQALQTPFEWKYAIISLLESYEKEYHFCFEDAKEILNELSEAEIRAFTDAP